MTLTTCCRSPKMYEPTFPAFPQFPVSHKGSNRISDMNCSSENRGELGRLDGVTKPDYSNVHLADIQVGRFPTESSIPAAASTAAPEEARSDFPGATPIANWKNEEPRRLFYERVVVILHSVVFRVQHFVKITKMSAKL